MKLERPDTLDSGLFNDANQSLLTPVTDESSSLSPNDKKLSPSGSEEENKVCISASSNSHESLQLLMGSESDSRSNVLSHSSKEYCTAETSTQDSEIRAPLCTTNDDSTLETHTTISENFDSGTLTSSVISDGGGTLTPTTLDYSDAPPIGDQSHSFQEGKPLIISSSSPDYVSTKEYLEEESKTTPNNEEHSFASSSPYTESGSDPLSSSLTEGPDPSDEDAQTPLSDDQSGPQMSFNDDHRSFQSSSHSSPAKKISNNGNSSIKRHSSSIEFSVYDHDGNLLSNTLPSFSSHKNCNGTHHKESTTPFYSVDSHLDTREETNRLNNHRHHRSGSTAIRRRPGRRMDKSRIKVGVYSV